MKLHILLAAVLLQFINYSQVDKKLLKIFGDEFVQMRGEEEYPWRHEGQLNYHLSTTLKDDTTGVSDQMEFLLFRDSIVFENGELYKLVRKEHVTNREYNEFVDWVLDSNYRELIYINDNPTGNDAIQDELIGEMLVHGKTYVNHETGKEELFDPSNPAIMRELYNFDYNFDWRKKINYSQYIPLIDLFNYRPNERYLRVTEVDERRLWYDMYQYRKYAVLISRDREIWANKSEYPFDLYYNLANHYWKQEPYKDMAVQGLLGTQVKGFLLWKERQIQAQIDAKKMNYRVRVTLPTVNEIKHQDPDHENQEMGFETFQFDMTEQWQITNAEYWEFMLWVQDSLFREALYLQGDAYEVEYEDIAEMLQHEDVYYDDVNLQWREFDPADRFTNRSDFWFDWDKDWDEFVPANKKKFIIGQFFMEPTDVSDEGEYDPKRFNPTKLSYKYVWKDLKRKASEGEFVWKEGKGFVLAEGSNEYESRDYDLSHKLREGWKYNSGVRRNKNYGEHIIEETLNIYPGIDCRACNYICWTEHGEMGACNKCTEINMPEIYDFESDPTGLVKGLTYHQAVAFYYWKYVRHNYIKGTSYLQKDWMPSPEEFERVQAGGQAIKAPQRFPYPSPAFRYVIHVYPK